MAAYRTVSVELDGFDLAVLISHARDRINESSRIVRAEKRAGRPNSITAYFAEESLGNWKVTLSRLNRANAEMRRQQREARLAA